MSSRFFVPVLKNYLYISNRTPGTGLYDNLQRYNIPYPEAIFELNYFYRNPNPFFHLAKELYPGKYLPNVIHYFIRYLHEQNILHRVYTQNIDGLERSNSIEKIVLLIEFHFSIDFDYFSGWNSIRKNR